MNLKELKAKLKERLAKQRKHYQKWKHFNRRGKLGDKVRAAYQLRQFKKHRKAVKKLARLIYKEKKRLASLRIPVASGQGAWEGTESVAREIEAVVERLRGECSGSEKRWETYGNPGSDHHMSQTDAYAIDFYLANDYTAAEAIARHFKAEWAGDYDNFTVERGGNWFRIQLIAGTHGTGPHLHAGIRRV